MSDILAIGNKGGESKKKWLRIGKGQQRYQKYNNTVEVDKIPSLR